MKSFVEMTSGVLQKNAKKGIWNLTAKAAERQWWSSDKLREYSAARLRELLLHAEQHVPYYHDLFQQNGVNLSSPNIASENAKIPLLDKDLLRANYDSLVSSSAHSHNAHKNASGGSTGKPVSFLTDRQIFEVMFAQMNVFFSWAGWEPGEAIFYFWGGDERHLSLSWLGKLKRFVNRNYVFPVYFYDEKSYEEWWRQINIHKPKLFYAYPSVLSQFCLWLQANSYEYEGLKGVFTSAEVLYDHQRELIERTFGCKVFNQYGCREAPAIACECPAGNMHYMIDLNHIEFKDIPGEKDSKEIIVTPLFNYAQPLIRYNLMDWGRPVDGTCSCGRGYPLMAMEIGRRNDHVIGKNGMKVFPSFFLHMLDGEGWIRNYQFRQKGIDMMELYLETEDQQGNEKNVQKLEERILPLIRGKLGDSVNLTINLTSTIERSSAGKHRFVLNETGL